VLHSNSFFCNHSGYLFHYLCLLLTCFSVELNAPKDCCARCKVVPPPICCDLCHPDAVSRFVPGLTAIINLQGHRKPKQIKVTPYESSMAEQSLKNELLTCAERMARNLFAISTTLPQCFFTFVDPGSYSRSCPCSQNPVSSRSQESNLVGAFAGRIWWRHYHARQAALSPIQPGQASGHLSCVDPLRSRPDNNQLANSQYAPTRVHSDRAPPQCRSVYSGSSQ